MVRNNCSSVTMNRCIMKVEWFVDEKSCRLPVCEKLWNRPGDVATSERCLARHRGMHSLFRLAQQTIDQVVIDVFRSPCSKSCLAQGIDALRFDMMNLR